jgi:hypothetical protein
MFSVCLNSSAINCIYLVPHYVYVIIILVFLALMYFFLLFLKRHSFWRDVFGMKLALSILVKICV